MVRTKRQRLNLVVDPRFSGGTTAAVAREIYALAPLCDLSLTAISSKLFKGKTVHPLIARACEELNVPIVWDPATVSSDLVALHNPSFLKFDHQLSSRITCDRLFVVCHENFVRPGGPEGFDVSHCLDVINQQTLARKKYLSPVSAWNRQCTKTWMRSHPGNWEIAPFDWTNICDFQMKAPTPTPGDRRGRHSRPGAEKSPPIHDLLLMFPETCAAVRLLGADGLVGDDRAAHWELLDFGAEQVDAFLETIDFFVYFTHPFWQESFGRVIAEAIAAGKVVITSPAVASSFLDAVIAANPADVDAIVAKMIADPALYASQVKRSQAALVQFGAPAFRHRFQQLLTHTAPTAPTNFATEKLYDLL